MNAGSFSKPTLTGKLVRLTAVNPEKITGLIARWNLDSEYQQLLDSGPAQLWTAKQMQEFFEKHLDEMFGFTIQSLENDQDIGFVDLSGVDWVAGNCWVGIGIGERDYWGRGYGSEAMRLVLDFGFGYLNLRRVSLTVFEYNQRAYQSYIKCGFQEEGRLRQWMQRSGERFDLIYMGILRQEWETAQGVSSEPAQVSASQPGNE